MEGLLLSDHFSVDGTLIDAWASMNSFVAKDGTGNPPPPGRNAERSFHKAKRSNAIYASTTGPDAKLFGKGDGQESRLCFTGSALTESRNGLIVGADVMRATGTAEREAALILIDRVKPPSRGVTLGADKLYDAAAFIAALRSRKVTPHVAVNGAVPKTGKLRSTLVDGRTTQHEGYSISQRIRKRIGEGCGWGKTIAGLRKVKLRGLHKVRGPFTFTMAAYNLIRIPKLPASA